MSKQMMDHYPEMKFSIVADNWDRTWYAKCSECGFVENCQSHISAHVTGIQHWRTVHR